MSQTPTVSEEEPEFLFPFECVASGDSFFIPTLKPASMVYTVNKQANLAEIRIRAFATTKDGLLGVRVWRV